jgi:prevent-host-death family protein
MRMATYTRRMTTRIPIRQLQRHASDLLDRVAAGETLEITRNGQLVGIIVPPDPRQQVIDELLAEGFLTPEELAKPGLGNWTTPGEPLEIPLSDALRELREEEDR